MANSSRGAKASDRKAPNIYDVAREARVSVFTVSAVINNKAHVGSVLKKRVDAAIMTFESSDPQWSYSLERKGRVVQVAEQEARSVAE